MKPQKIGNFSVRKLVEVVDYLSPEFAFNEYDESKCKDYLKWLSPHFMLSSNAGINLLFSFHSFVVQGNNKTILIDTCIGNHKERSALPSWHNQNRPYIDNLRSMGIDIKDIDYVMCTHLHADHVGWNTQLINGKWIPTFPNAKYIFSKMDYQKHDLIYKNKSKSNDQNPNPGEGDFYASWEDSIIPVINSGNYELVDYDYNIDDSVSIIHTPGHTPGHFCVHLKSQGQEAFFTGDMMHHPLLVSEPQWVTHFCLDPKQSTITRRKFIDKNTDNGAVIFAAHFAGPTAGQITNRHGFQLFKGLENA
tara:strand:+ start:76 stop:993 length:918 start_codon:yes stop_codon:yes gene_type:complete